MPQRPTSKHHASFGGFNTRSGLSKPIKGVSALGALITASSATACNTGMAVTASAADTIKSTTANLKSKHPKRPDIQPYYQTVGGPRSMSYGVTPSPRMSSFLAPIETGNLESSFVESNPSDGYQSSNSRGLRKSRSLSKSGKKALKMRFHKLRKRRGSRESGDDQDEASSESDTEFNAPTNRDGTRGRGFVKKLKSSKQKTLNADPPLPPPPPQQIRDTSGQSRESPTITMPTYAMSFGFGATGTLPLSVVTKRSDVPGTTRAAASWPTSAAPSAPGTPSGEPSKESSTARFKEMIKRNVGLSSTSSAAASIPSSSATSPSFTEKQNHQPWNAIGDLLLSGDEQTTSLFSVSRLKGQRKKLTKIAKAGTGVSEAEGTGTGPGCIPLGENDDQVIYTTMLNNPHQYHFRAFIPYLRPPTHDNCPQGDLNSILEGALGEKEFNLKIRRKQTALISRALAEARQSSKDPNVLLTELEPLPSGFTNAFNALAAPPVQNEPVLAPNSATVAMWSSMPAATGTTGGGMETGNNNIQQLPIMSSIAHSAVMPSTISAISGSLLTVQAPPAPSSSPSSTSYISKSVKVDLPNPSPLAPRSFLFKSYQHSKFQGHYVFRVQGNSIEYGKLPVSLDSACSEYFREADKTYRALEHKAKLWRDKRRAAFMKREQEFKHVWQTDILLCDASEPAEVSGNESDSCQYGENTGDDPLSSIEKYSSMNQECLVDTQGTLDPYLTNAISDFDAEDSPNDSSSFFSNSYASSCSSAITPITSYFSTSARIGDAKRRDSDPSSIISVEQSENSHGGTRIDGENLEKDCIPNVPIMQGRMWEESSTIKEHTRLEQMQRAIDNAYWQKVELNHCEESKQQLYGLYLYLENLTKKVEFERFEKICHVEILKAHNNEGQAVERNCSKTSLCSSFTKDKEEEENNMNKENIDCLVDMGDVRLSLLQQKLRDKHTEIQQTMQELEEMLEKLSELDENAKKLAAEMGRTLDMSQVRNALQPCPATGLTIAETVDCKIRDVNERIVVCARIMNAARLNLNRLEYEIELEQRSIRLFRQYKIGIAVFTILVLGFLWLVYNRRNAIAKNLFHPPMSSVPLSPLEVASMNLQSEPVSKSGLPSLFPPPPEVCR
ncbi:hypothetical protein BGX27_001025 [Mortierella sp. AM989]|nr:hypothetical protein BGX27_001025 [Mortierella sp. AM989]